MSLGNDPRKTPDPDPDTPTEAQHALAAVAQARAELLVDGRAPSKERILQRMGRKPDGTPICPGTDETKAPHKAGQVARNIVREWMGSHE